MSELMHKFKLKSLEFKMKFSMLWSVFAIAYITAVTFIDVPLTNERIVDQVLGFIMGTVAATAINYWIGNSVEQDTSKKEEPNVETIKGESTTDANVG